MLQAPVLDGLSFDPYPFQQDGLAAPEVDIGEREVIQGRCQTKMGIVMYGRPRCCKGKTDLKRR